MNNAGSVLEGMIVHRFDVHLLWFSPRSLLPIIPECYLNVQFQDGCSMHSGAFSVCAWPALASLAFEKLHYKRAVKSFSAFLNESSTRLPGNPSDSLAGIY